MRITGLVCGSEVVGAFGSGHLVREERGEAVDGNVLDRGGLLSKAHLDWIVAACSEGAVIETHGIRHPSAVGARVASWALFDTTFRRQPEDER